MSGNRERARQFFSEILLALAPLKTASKENVKVRSEITVLFCSEIIYSSGASHMTETRFLFTRLSSPRRQLCCSESIKFTEVS